MIYNNDPIAIRYDIEITISSLLSFVHGCSSLKKLYPVIFCVKRTLALKETPNSTKQLNKNENYNEIIEMPFVFNL